MQNRSNVTSSEGSEKKTSCNFATKSASYGVTQNKYDGRQLNGPNSHTAWSGHDEDITFVSQTKPQRETGNMHGGGQRKVMEKNKKVCSVTEFSRKPYKI